MFFASCSTSTHLAIYGDPGTQILTPSKTTLATIDNSGKVDIYNPDDDYYAFLISHKPGTDEYIPFALDYNYNYHGGARFLAGIGLGIECVGAILFATASKEDSSIGSLGAMGVLAGFGIGTPGYEQSQQTNHDYCYKYTSIQKTNQDIKFTKPISDLAVSEFSANIDNHEPDISTPSVSPAQLLNQKKINSISETSLTNKTLSSSTSAKSLKDNATKIEGTYIGDGVLNQGDDIIETYNNISVKIIKKSKDVVLVNVVESDGSQFFTMDGEYNIKKQSDGKFLLSLKDIHSATIEIDEKNNLIYIHPRVNIDGEIYKLNIKAKR